MREIRGNRISMIFQEPMTSLNPVLTVGQQIAETRAPAPEASSRAEALERAVEMLRAGAASPSPSGAPTSIRTSSPAACASG